MTDRIHRPQPCHIAVLISFSGAGGVEKMVLNLIKEWVGQAALQIDLLAIRTQGPWIGEIPAGVRVIRFKARHTLTAVPELIRYLKDARPSVILAAKDRAGRLALLARALSGVETRVVIRLGTHLSASLRHRSTLTRWLRIAPLRRLYPRADRIIGISAGVLEDIQALTGLPDDRLSLIRNPVVTASMQQMAKAPVPHPWLDGTGIPVVLGAGRLTRQKDFPTLIRAFARVRSSRPCHLIIIGEGSDRPLLEGLVAALCLEQAVLLPGFQANPYAWIGRADLFVLSSRWEGSGNTLTEALALGVPCVATDCPSGPSETLAQGQLGELVPVGDVECLAAAMGRALDGATRNPARTIDPDFRAEISAKRYLEVLCPDRDG